MKKLTEKDNLLVTAKLEGWVQNQIADGESEEETWRYVWSNILNMTKELAKVKAKELAKIIFHNADKYVKEEFLKVGSRYQKEVNCKKGCSACCYVEVAAGPTEVRAALTEAKKVGLQIDWGLLEKQATWDFDAKNPAPYLARPASERRCVFLTKEGSCGVYPARPLVCRTHFSADNPILCDTDISGSVQIRMPIISKAEILTSALSCIEPPDLLAKVIVAHRKWYEKI